MDESENNNKTSPAKVDADEEVAANKTKKQSMKRQLHTRSPTDDASSPISKVLVGAGGKKRSRSQALNAVISNARNKRTRELDCKSIAPIPASENSTVQSIVDKHKDRIRKLVLVPLSPNVPRIINPKKTPKADKTPKASEKTSVGKTPKSASSKKNNMFDVLADDE